MQAEFCVKSGERVTEDRVVRCTEEYLETSKDKEQCREDYGKLS